MVRKTGSLQGNLQILKRAFRFNSRRLQTISFIIKNLPVITNPASVTFVAAEGPFRYTCDLNQTQTLLNGAAGP